jgi:biopolymer transport protein ExbD
VSTPDTSQEHEHEDEDADRERRKYRSGRRKQREAASEIKELNITAMMDMMTIILVFLIKSYTASSTNVQMSDALQIPRSTTQSQPQENVVILVTAKEVSVNDKNAAPIENGLIPAGFREDGGLLVPPLLAALEKEVQKQKYIAKYNPNTPFTGRVNVIADKRIPYQTILAVLYTAGQAELGQYKLMAQKNEM